MLKEWISNHPQSSGILSVKRSSLGVMICVSRSVDYHQFLFFGMIQLFSTSAVYLYILFRCLIKCRGQEYLRNKFLYIELFTLCTYWQEFQKESGELRTGRTPLSPRHSSSLSQSRGRKTQQLQRDPTSIQSNFISLIYWELCLQKLVRLTITIIF